MPAMHAKRRDEYTAAQLIEALRHLHLTPTDLTALIQLVHEFIDEDMTRRTTEIKQSRDGAGLNMAIIKQMLAKGDCPCVAAARLNSE